MDFTQVAEVFDSFVGVASPGAAIEIRTHGKVLFRRAGGLTGIAEAGRNQFGEPVFDGSDVDRGTLVGEHTSFDLASLTKPLSTALLVALACDDGDLSLDETLGSFDFLGVPPARAGVSIRDLLLHRSGLVAWLPFAQKLVPSHGVEVCGSETARAECVLMAMNSAPGSRPGVTWFTAMLVMFCSASFLSSCSVAPCRNSSMNVSPVPLACRGRVSCQRCLFGAAWIRVAVISPPPPTVRCGIE